MPQTAPGVLAWIEHADDWEQHRRREFDYELQLPEAAIPPEEDAVRITTAMIPRDQFARDSRAVLARLDALVELVGRGELRQARCQPADE